MAGFDEDVIEPGSSTGTEVLPQQGDPSSAGTQNTDQQGPPQRPGNWMPQDRAEQMAQRRVEHALAQQAQAFAAERQQLTQFFSQQSQAGRDALIQGLQQRANQPSRTPEQEAERRQATELLHDLAPGLKHMPALAEATIDARNRLAQQEQRMGQLEAASARTYIRGEQSRLAQLATDAGLSIAKGPQFTAFENHITEIIRADPNAARAFADGDPGVLPWALDLAKPHYAAGQQSARAALARTKSGMPPPRIGGSQPGSMPIPRFDPKDPRGSMAKIHAGAEADLLARLGG